MPNFEITISPNYVLGWGVREATRELLQNAFDQQTVNPENVALVSYDPELQLLKIGNRSSNLDPSTLVLGNGSKAHDERLVGQFGEGYKLALIVFLRLGKSITIYNNPDVWTPTIKKSDAFKTPILNIHTVKYRFKTLPEHDLIFEIRGITTEEWADIQDKNRYFHTPTEDPELLPLQHTYGTILREPRYKGQIFVKGLFVTQIDDLSYGYDMLPQYLEIGRDRDLVNTWSIIHRTSAMWAAQKEVPELVNRLLEENIRDLQMLEHCVWQLPAHTVEYIGSRFYGREGLHAVPCANEEEAKLARDTYGAAAKVVIVSDTMAAILKRSPQFKERASSSLTTNTPQQIIQALLDHPDRDRYKTAVRADLEEILKISAHWTWKS